MFFKFPFHLSSQLILFIFFFGCLAIFINSNDIRAYNLQQIGIEAIVERGHTYLEDASTPGLIPVLELWADVVPINGHYYPGKQPGQFIFGSIVYFFLHTVGITYKKDLILTGGLVTLFTSVLITAIVLVLLFNISFDITKSIFYSFIVSIFCGFGTLLFPYSGVTHHDIYATFFLFTGFYILFYKYHIRKTNYLISIFISGFLIGIAIFCSFKAVPIIFTLLFYYSVLSKNWRKILFFTFSIFCGILPSLIYNYYILGNIFSFPEIVSNPYPTSMPFHLSIKNILEKFNNYFLSPVSGITFFSPIYIISLLGFFLLPNKYLAEKIIIPTSLIFTFLQMSSIQSFGACQYGPRNLLCTMPFILFGLCGFFTSEKNNIGEKINKYKYCNQMIFLIGAISIFICMVGSIIGTMYCNYGYNAFLSHLTNIVSGDIPTFPFVGFGIICIFLSLILYSFKEKEVLERLQKLATLFHSKHGIKYCYLSTILVIGFLLRLIKLDSIPLGLYSDEASIGYNAYCISETGKDEYGETFPVYFKAFGEYKNPVLVYVASLFIKAFGPTIFSLRFASCFLGLLAIFFTYKLAKLYFNKPVALIAALLLAISPWHIHYSRISMDPIAFPTFFIMGFYFLSVGLKKRDKYILFSSVPLVLSLYSYAIAKAFVPLFVFFFLLFNVKEVLRKKQAFITLIFLISIMLVPMINSTLHSGIQDRFNMLSISNEYFSLSRAKEEIKNTKYYFLADNNTALLCTIFIKNYFKHFSLDFLLKNGDRNPRHHIGNRGQLLLFTFVIAIIGFFYLIFKRDRVLYIFPTWLILFPIPASLTWESLPHASRTICALPIFEILASVGFIFAISLIKGLLQNSFNFIQKMLGCILLISLTIFTVIGLLDINKFIRDYFTIYATSSRYAFDYNIYAIAKATKDMKYFDRFIVPFDFREVIFLYLHKVNPKLWITNKSSNRYVRENTSAYDLTNRNIASISSPSYTQDESIVNIVIDEVTNETIYEIKKVKKPALIARQNFKPNKIGGLTGDYYNGINFEKLILSKIDPDINFIWGWGSPNDLINDDYFSIRWSGWINIREHGSYNFITENDDGVRLFIDGTNIIDDWSYHAPKINTGIIELQPGWHTILIEYFEYTADNKISLTWETPNGYKGPIPKELLSPDPIVEDN